jgi:hypothetical protein
MRLFPVPGQLSLLVALAVCSCKDEPKPAPNPAAAHSAAPIPPDFVVNSFFTQFDGGSADLTSAAAATTAAPAADPAAQGAEAPAGGPSNVKLLSPGEEPRAVRRWDFKLGRTETVIATVRASQSVEMAGQPPQKQDQPPMQFTIAVSPKKKTPAGDFEIGFVLTKADIVLGKQDQALADKLADPLKALSGMSGGFRVTPTGSVSDFDVAPNKAPREAQQEIIPLVEQAMQSIVVALPSEPVGKGAQWEEKATNKEQGISLTSTATYTLKEVGEGGLVVSVTTTRKAPAQAVNDPRAPKGTTIAVEGGGTTTVKFRLDRMALKATADATTGIITSQPTPGGPKALTQKVILKETVENTSP